MIKAIIFDFDGVLAESEHLNIEGGVRTFRELGHELNDEEKKFIVGKHSRDSVPHFMKSRDIKVEEEVVTKRYREIYDEIWEGGIRVMPAIQETLKILKERGVILAIATNNRRSRVEMFLRRFELEGMFSVIVGMEKIIKRKPDPEVYLKALEELKQSPDVCIAIEDSDVGLRAAKAAGLRCVVIPNEHTASHDFSSADFILKNSQDLLGLIS